jgi:hypothetical protein
MQYRYRETSKGSVVLTRSSRRYALSFAFLVIGAFCLLLGVASRSGRAAVRGLPVLLPYALGLISLSTSLLNLMNHGAPRSMVLDRSGLRMSVKRRKYLIPRGEIRGAWARKTVSFGFWEDTRRGAIFWKAYIALESGSIVPLYEGPSRARAEALSAACAKALGIAGGVEEASTTAPPEKKPHGESASESRSRRKADPYFAIETTGEGVEIEVPIRMNVPGIFMASGMLAGTGIILFGILPGVAEPVAFGLLCAIWGLIALVVLAALGFALVGRQKLVLSGREVEARRSVLGLLFPPARLDKSEAASVYLDLEDNSLSVISRELKRELDRKMGVSSSRADQDPDVKAAAEAMSVFLSGRIVRVDVSALSWIDRFELEREVRAALEKKG